MTKTKNKQPYKKIIKTARKTHQTFTLTNYVITTLDGEISDDFTQQVEQELRKMSELMMKNENAYYQQKFRTLISELADENATMKGKKNAALRKYIDDIPYPPTVQPYNFKEMLRYNIASKTDIYIRRYKTELIIKDFPDKSARDIRKIYCEYYDNDNVPSVTEIKKYQAAVQNSGNIDSLPHSNGQLPISATDGHYRHLEVNQKEKIITLSLKLSCGECAIHFRMPKKLSRYDGKITAPTIRVKNNKLLFDFTSQKNRPPKAQDIELSGYIGVDAGEITTASYGFISKDGHYSQPFLETKRVRLLEQRIKKLFSERDHLLDKAELCDVNGFFDKANILYSEARARRHKISVLKKQVNELVACEIVRSAIVLGAGIAVEDLAWTPESHWDYADLQDRLANLAADCGVPVVRVNAAGTSKTCPCCGSELTTAGYRRKSCGSCGWSGDRDVVGYRNVGLRACSLSSLTGNGHFLVGLGRRSFRRECDVLARCNKLRPLNAPLRPCFASMLSTNSSNSSLNASSALQQLQEL